MVEGKENLNAIVYGVEVGRQTVDCGLNVGGKAGLTGGNGTTNFLRLVAVKLST